MHQCLPKLSTILNHGGRGMWDQWKMRNGKRRWNPVKKCRPNFQTGYLKYTYYTFNLVTFLHDNMGSPVTLDPKQCLLGIFPDPSDKFTKIFLQETLFSGRKIIARRWMRSTPLEIKEWMADINVTLPYKRFLYINRGCPDKFNRIWDRWVQDSETCS